MKRVAVLTLILGVVVLGTVLGLRVFGLASITPVALEVPPGEGRLDQPADVYAGLFRSWSLGGREGMSAAQEEAVLRLGLARGSRLISLEIRRRELERTIAEARTELERVRAASPVATPEAAEPWPAETEDPGTAPVEDEASRGATDGESVPADVETDALDAEFVMPLEEVMARENLARLEEEYEKIRTDLAPQALTKEKGRVAEIAVLAGGAARGVQTLLAGWGQPFQVVEAGPGLAGLAREKPVLIVPSGALDRRIAGPLAAYARAGGTVLSLAQRNGAVLHSLPGGPRGFGWTETESAFEASVEVAAVHPATCACRKPRFSAAVDGFFTSLPDGAEILLRSAVGGRPVAVTYPFGKGRVAAATLYTDWEAMSRPAGVEEGLFLRDLVLWAVARGTRWQQSPVPSGSKVEVSLPLANATEDMAKTVMVCYLTPEGRFCKPFALDLRMLPRETQDKKVIVHAPSTPGVWHLVYALTRADGSLLQYWRNGRDLAVGQPAVAPAPTGIGAAITTTAEILRAGKAPAQATVNVWNYGTSSAEVKCSGPTGTVSTVIPAGGNKRLTFRIPTDKRAAAKGYFEFTLSGPAGLVHLSKLLDVLPVSREGGAR